MKNLRTICFGAALAATTLTACGSGDDDEAIAVPEGADFCSVFNDEYLPIVRSPTAFGEDGFDEETDELIRLARILEQVSPEELSGAAAQNVGYYEAIGNTESVADFVDGNLELFTYGLDNC